MAGRNHSLRQSIQIVECDVRRFGIETAQDVADDAHGAGTAERLQPAELAICPLDGFQFEPDGGARSFEALRRYPAIVEINGAQADTDHRKALEQQRLEA